MSGAQTPSALLPLDALLDRLQFGDDGQWHADVPEDWMQGRTLYGGVSSALCLAAARRAFPDLPPLRSAQIAFAGPAAGRVSARPDMLRAGKSAAFVGVDLVSEAGFGVRATFCFAADRASSQRQTRLPAPDVPAPDRSPDHFGGEDRPRPAFAHHFQMRLAAGAPPVSGAAEADMTLWLRDRDAGATPRECALLALADAPPPAALSLFETFTPLSTMTWMVDILSGDLGASGDWVLGRMRAEAVGDGYSAQSMYLWSADGRPLMAARQCVALFG